MKGIVGLILARGGSKGIQHKNIRNLAGKPLIAWTIDAARASQCFDRVVVSTDDDEIAEVSRNFGAETPFMRPADLSQDNSPSIGAVLHAVRWMADHDNFHPEYVMLLQPTSPLRLPEDIQESIKVARDRQADAVVSVTSVHQHPYWMKTISSDGCLADFLSQDGSFASRQELPPAYALNGAIYLIKRDILLARGTFFVENTTAYVMPPERSMDIDTLWEFHLAELILKENI